MKYLSYRLSLLFHSFVSVVAAMLPNEWEMLGPFPHGSREVGVDPLSIFGGFENLIYNEEIKYPSEIANGGYVSWKKLPGSDKMTIVYENINWNQHIYSFGWAVLQHASYLRGNFIVEEEGIYSARFNGVYSFKIDSQAFPGNLYSFDHAADSTLYLSKGKHSVYVCIVHDIRIHGNSLPPKTEFSGSIQKVNMDQYMGTLIYPSDTILPELYENRLLSSYGSVVLKNAHTFSKSKPWTIGNDLGWKQVLSVNVKDENGPIPVVISTVFTIYVAPGQIVAIPFKFERRINVLAKIEISVDLLDHDTEIVHTVNFGNFELYQRTKNDELYKFTFPGFDYTIQYAFAKPPKVGCDQYTNKKCPVIVALHGARFYVSSPEWLEAVNAQNHAWVMFPSGRTKWGLDWHGSTYKNIDSSLEAMRLLPGIFEQKYLEMFQLDPDRLIMVGHSNGGHGAWWFTSHYPDRVIAAIPAAGFMNLQFYVPYYMHVGSSYSDPIMNAYLESSIAENNIDLYSSNLANIPILSRLGEIDTTVPIIHTRRLVRLIDEWSGKSNAITYREDPGQPHWYKGILNDEIAQAFIDRFIDPLKNPDLKLPELPNPFVVSTLNPGSSGSRGGINILQLIVPFRLATIKVERQDFHWKLTTTNVRRFGFVHDERQKGIATWSIDDTVFSSRPAESGLSYLKTGNTTWELAEDLLWISRERNPTTYGPISQIFGEPFRIVVPTVPTANLTLYNDLAQQISTLWYIYGKGSTQIIRDVDLVDGISAKYNLIVLGDPRDNYYTLKRTLAGKSKLFAFRSDGALEIDGKVYDQHGTGALFLAPSVARTRLCLFITGIDAEGIKRATWTLPFITGIQVADYVVVGQNYGDAGSGWTATSNKKAGGAGGILATGFWNNEWEYHNTSGYLK